MLFRIFILLAVSCSVAKAQVALAADSVTGLPGQSLEVPVRAFQWQDIVSFQGTLEWDPQVVTFDTVYQYGLPGMNPSNFGLSLTGSGKMTYSWNENSLMGTNLPDSTPVFVLRFELTGAMGTQSPLDFVSDPTALEFVDANFSVLNFNVVPGEVQIEDTVTVGVEERAANWRLYPHPIKPNSVIEWEGSENAQWVLWDVRGKIVGTGQVASSGTWNRTEWQELNVELKEGALYWLEWESAGKRRLEKVAIEQTQ